MRPRCLPLSLAVLALAASLAAWMAAPAAAQLDIYPRLGLSASPTSFVDSLSAAPGEPFVAYMLFMGPDYGEGPEPYPFTQLQWIKHTGCCGVVFEVLDVEYNPDLEHVGTPTEGVISTAPECMASPIVCLATITFSISVPESGIAQMPAGASGPAYDCNDGTFLCFDLLLRVYMEGSVSAIPEEEIGEPTPSPETATWGGIKSIYR